MSTMGEHLARNPIDLTGLDGVRDPKVFMREYHRSISDNLRSAGFLPPADGVTKPVEEPEDTGGFFDGLLNSMFSFKGSQLFGDANGDLYEDKRFDFIAGASQYQETTFKDRLGRSKIGYDFNLSDPEMREMAKKVLGKSDDEIDAIEKGTSGISSRDARVLYEARVARAERHIKNTFKDVPLSDSQRLALVSLSYQNEGLIGPNLTKLVKEGNWQGVQEEILERSNRYKLSDVQSRRKREAALFGGMHSKDQPVTDEQSFSLSSLFNQNNASESAPASEPSQAEMEADPLYGEYLTGQQLAEEYRRDSGLKLGESLQVTADGESVGTVNDLLGMVPAHVRMLIEDVAKTQLGIDKTEDIKTSDFFNDEELTGLMEVVKRSRDANGGANSGVVEYTGKNSGYEDGVEDVTFAGNDLSIVDSDSTAVIKKTLGQFSWEINDQGELIVTDTYDFNDAEEMQAKYSSGFSKATHLMGLTGKWAMSGLAGAVGIDAGQPPIGLYGIVRRAAALYGSKEGEGMQFKINLGKVDFDKIR
jgi:GH24 family phage-related lysozyme (muramidase)